MKKFLCNLQAFIKIIIFMLILTYEIFAILIAYLLIKSGRYIAGIVLLISFIIVGDNYFIKNNFRNIKLFLNLFYQDIEEEYKKDNV